ncbi:MAG: hypothetical protein INQ03_05995 [Candidatus Heimdallarchaeota archaeon]|nr:hypothetical protein [Candidatus Heimdallarchaeota archaeon]
MNSTSGMQNELTGPIGSDLSTETIYNPVLREFNASISDTVRNVTITSTARVVLEDQLTLKIYGNETFIDSFNFTIPSVFDKNVVKATFYSKQGTSNVGLQTPKYMKTYSKYVGEEATIYNFKISENGTLANSSKDVHIYAKLETLDAIHFKGVDEIQRGTFVSPLIPIYNNLEIDQNLVGIKIETAQDTFKKDLMNKIEANNDEFPILRLQNVLEWINISRSQFDPLQGLIEDYDYTTVIFDSDITGTDAETSDNTAVSSFVFSKLDRHLKVDPWGFVYVTESFTMLHTGAPRLENTWETNFQILGFTFQVTDLAKVTGLYDSQGRLNIGVLDKGDLSPITTFYSGRTLLEINFRNGIYGGEEYTFNVEYRMNASDVISVQDNTYALNTTLFSIFNTTAYHMSTTYELPAGANFQSHSFVSECSKSLVTAYTEVSRSPLSYFKHVELTFDIVNATYVDNNQFTIYYEYNGVGHFQYIFTFMIGLIFLLLLLFVSTKINIKQSKAIEVEREKLPVDEIEAFLRAFTEESDAYKTIADLGAKRRKNKISKKDYTSTIKSINKRIRDNKPVLEEALANLSRVGPKYERLVSKIMISSQKISDIRSNVASARNSYTKKQIKKDIYQKMMREYTLETDKQESIVNRSLSELRDLIQ